MSATHVVIGQQESRSGILRVGLREGFQLAELSRVDADAGVHAAERRPIPPRPHGQDRMNRRRRLLIVLLREQHERAELVQHGVVGILSDPLVGDVESRVVIVLSERGDRVVQHLARRAGIVLGHRHRRVVVNRNRLRVAVVSIRTVVIDVVRVRVPQITAVVIHRTESPAAHSPAERAITIASVSATISVAVV